MASRRKNQVTKQDELNQRELDFCYEYVVRGSGPKAYRAAYNARSMSASNIYYHAATLLKKPHIAAYIAELQAEQRQNLSVTMGTIANELDENRDLALANNQIAAANTATQTKAKIFGILQDRSEIDVTHHQALNYELLTTDEKRVLLALVQKAQGLEVEDKPALLALAPIVDGPLLENVTMIEESE